MRRTKEEAEQTKADILEAALAVFSQAGYQAARLEDIAAAAHVTRGAIYHHFDSKANLYMSLIEEAADTAGKAIDQAIQGGGSMPEIIARILVSGMNLLHDDQRFRQVTALSLYQATTELELQALSDRRALEATQLVDSIQGFFQSGIDQGELRADIEASTLARALLAYQNGLALLWLANTEAFSIKNQAGDLADLFLHGITS